MDFNNEKKAYGVAIGNFDGVHKGHCFLAETLIKECNKLNLEPVAYTFKNHPFNYFNPKMPVKLIMSNEKKEELLKECGIKEVVFEDFDEKIAELSPEDFVRNVLVERLGAKLVVVGENFTFGKNNSGNASDLKKLGEKYGFSTIVVPSLKIEDNVVSSTLLRSLVMTGNVETFPKYAGRLYTIPGNVLHGREIGRTLGFPTANIEQDKGFVLPLPGVYETETKIGDKIYKGVTNVGNNPTFSLNHIVVETHILDYNKDIYGKYIEVGFVRRLRGEIKFESIEALKKQIETDKNNVKTRS